MLMASKKMNQEQMVTAITFEIAKLELGPNDVLLIRIPPIEDKQQWNGIVHSFAKALQYMPFHYILATTDTEFSVVSNKEK